jgi:hypothetical protein
MEGETPSPETLKRWSELIGINLDQDRLERLPRWLLGSFQDMKVLDDIEIQGEEPAFILPPEQE